jgi:hypothetical protein
MKAVVPTKKDKKSEPQKAAGAERAKLEQIAAMLRKPGGASLPAIAEAAGWQPHTARGRISDGVSKLLNEGEEIWSRRSTGGLTHYAIMKREGPVAISIANQGGALRQNP